MPAPSLSRSTVTRYTERLDHIESAHTPSSDLSVQDIRDCIAMMGPLRRRTVLGRTCQSYVRELAFYQRVYFTPIQTVTVRKEVERSPYAFFGGNMSRDYISTENLVQLALTSFDKKTTLLLSLDAHGDLKANGDSVSTSTIIEASPYDTYYVVPLVIRHKKPSYELELPRNVGRYLPFGVPLGLTIRKMPAYGSFLVSAMNRRGDLTAHLWEALERIWCEQLLRAHPMVRPLTRDSVDVRIRSLQGQTVRVEHTGGTALGRCPNTGEFANSATVDLRTGDGDMSVDAASVLEIVPWKAGWSTRSVATTP